MAEVETAMVRTIRKIDALDQNPKHDAPSRSLLEIMAILTRILKEFVEEYRECTLEEIERLIGPYRGSMKAELLGPFPEKVQGTETQDKTLDEKVFSCDLVLKPALPGAEGEIGLIINLESQYKFKLKYPLVKREVFYAVRLLSGENERDVENLDYKSLKKVYSIWICTNPSPECRNTITKFRITQENIVGDYVEPVENYDLIQAIQVGVGGPEDKNYGGILRMLDVLFAEKSRLSVEQKLEILCGGEYQIPRTREL